MELRKDPITRSWIAIGDPEQEQAQAGPCPLCPENHFDAHVLLSLPQYGAWQVRAIPHFVPLYRVEGDPERAADGIFDRMAAIGAHEVIVETPDHTRQLAQMRDEEIERVLEAWAIRIADLKRDARFKYITVFKNQGATAGEEWPHAHSQVVATTFVPRRILHELRAARDWYRDRERCVFCDILRQEIRQKKRVVDNVGDYYAFCPYASRVPFELWITPKTHNHLFESQTAGENRRHLATLLGRSLRRLLNVAGNYHLVLHTAPNTLQTKGELSDYWRTIAGDYHWHIEILPIVPRRAKSYSIKEVYFNEILPEQAAERLRQFDPAK
ncbi:MAG TPA: galactose-1-phosphate uridylyltransferase [Candidatus Aquilonibacter sp.]|nr:galactose-1-phosphate uridylyltransferase [Candidatus Aquilonibacter sp.]